MLPNPKTPKPHEDKFIYFSWNKTENKNKSPATI